jgi:hypothetical protein
MITIAVDDTRPYDRENLAPSRVTTANVVQLETGEPFLAAPRDDHPPVRAASG